MPRTSKIDPDILAIVEKYAPTILDLSLKASIKHNTLYENLQRNTGLSKLIREKLLTIISPRDVQKINDILCYDSKRNTNRKIHGDVISHPILQFVYDFKKPTISDILELMDIEKKVGFKFETVEEIKLIYGRLKKEQKVEESKTQKA